MTMLDNAFIGKTVAPTDVELTAAIGSAKAAWDELLARLAVELGATLHEWKCYAPQWGWALRVLRRKRTVVWLSPGRGEFEVTFILSGKAMAAARAAAWPKAIERALDAAKKYPEGHCVRLGVESPGSLGPLVHLAAVKLAN
jgi:hypothetical protein